MLGLVVDMFSILTEGSGAAMTAFEIITTVIDIITLIIASIVLLLKLIAFLDSRYKRK